jgi:transcriptional antiterminator Rof (Rho-off)
MAEETKSLQGWTPSLKTKDELYDAVEKAFDYRGDVTITLKDGRQIAGYVFDRHVEAPEPFMLVFPAKGEEKLRIAYAEIAGLAFAGQDLAAENSWSAYVAKHRK